MEVMEAKKNVILLMAGPLRPNPPPPIWKKGSKKRFFSLMARPFIPPPTGFVSYVLPYDANCLKCTVLSQIGNFIDLPAF